MMLELRLEAWEQRNAEPGLRYRRGAARQGREVGTWYLQQLTDGLLKY